MQQIVSGAVEGTPSIHNCVLAVWRGRDSFAWVGAAGTAHRQSREAMTAETPIFIASVTKLYTATAVMMLAEKGALTLDDPIAKHLPPELIRHIQVFDGVDYSGSITIRQLLWHRSGIPDYYDDKADDGRTLFELLKENPEQRWSVDDAIGRARNQMKPGFAPGAKTVYSDTNYQLLGKIIEAAANEPLDVVFANYFFTPLNLNHTWILGRPDAPADVFDGDVDITRVRYNTVYWADGGLVSTAEDMIAFLQALNQGRLVRPETLRTMHDWRDWRFPLKYGLGTMQFSLPRLAAALTGLGAAFGIRADRFVPLLL